MKGPFHSLGCAIHAPRYICQVDLKLQRTPIQDVEERCRVHIQPLIPRFFGERDRLILQLAYGLEGEKLPLDQIPERLQRELSGELLSYSMVRSRLVWMRDRLRSYFSNLIRVERSWEEYQYRKKRRVLCELTPQQARIPIEELQLSNQTYLHLRSACPSLGYLVFKSEGELKKMLGGGVGTIEEVKRMLAERGACLANDSSLVSEWKTHPLPYF